MKRHIYILILILAFSFVSCTSENDFEKGKKQLETMGYTDVKNTGYNMFCCNKDETFSTGFTAKGKDGNIVYGCFCSELGKGITIRFD